MITRTNKNYPNLNGAQVAIIQGSILFPLNDILITLISEPKLVIMALSSLIYDSMFSFNETSFVRYNIFDSMNQIRSILFHDCPQNCNQTYAYLDDDPEICNYKLVSISERIAERKQNGDIVLKNGRILRADQILINDVDNDYVIAYEPKGLLNLTTREDNSTPPATKQVVIEYITDVINANIQLLKSMSGDLIQFLQSNAVAIRELMQGCNDLTIEKMIEIGIPGLTSLLENPQTVTLLINRLHIPIETFIGLASDKRNLLILYYKNLITLTDAIPGFSWRDVLASPCSSVILASTSYIIPLIKANQLNRDELRELNQVDFTTRMLISLDCNGLPGFLSQLHRDGVLHHFIKDGTTLLAVLQNLDPQRRVTVVEALDSKLNYFINTPQQTDVLQGLLQSYGAEEDYQPSTLRPR